MSNPEYVKLDDEMYKINTDFRVAIKCNKIAIDNDIGDFERAMAIVYLLFGEKGLDCQNNGKLLELGLKYLAFGKTEGKKEEKEQDYELDFEKCEGLIKSSFKFDYNYDPYSLDYLHYYDFYNDLSNLSSNEYGTCCVLNRVMNLLNYDTKDIKDAKELQRIKKAKEQIIEMYCTKKEKKLTKEQQESAKEFYKSIGIEI